MEENDLISVGDAYRAMFEFLDAYWRRGGQIDDQIADLLGSASFEGQLSPTKTADPAFWYDWIEAIAKVKT